MKSCYFNLKNAALREAFKIAGRSALTVKNHQMTTGMTWCPVTNMLITKSKVASGAAWCPVSHGVSTKGIL